MSNKRQYLMQSSEYGILFYKINIDISLQKKQFMKDCLKYQNYNSHFTYPPNGHLRKNISKLAIFSCLFVEKYENAIVI